MYRNIYGDSVRDALVRVANCYHDQKGILVGFPGQIQLLDFAAAAPATHGMHYWRNQNVLVLALPTQVRRIGIAAPSMSSPYYTGGIDLDAVTEFSPTPPTLTAGDFQPTTIDGIANWATDGGSNLFLAAQNRQLSRYTTFSPATETLIGFNSTHVAYLDSYMLANVAGTNQFRYSDVLDPTTWGGTSVFSAAGSNDTIVALHVLNRRIYLFGEESIEIWENDGISPFSRVGGGFIETGTVSPYSVIIAAQSLFWLDRARRFSTFSGSNIQNIPSPYDVDLHKMPTVSDCRASTFDLFGSTIVVWDFPSAQRTFCLALHGESEFRWFEIGRFQGDRYTGMREHLFTYLPEYGVTLCISKDQSKIHMLSPASRAMGADSNPMRCSVATGPLDFGTLAMKRMNRLRIRVKRGYGGSSAAQMMVRWKDDNSGPWVERRVDLGATGQTDIPVQMLRLGGFRTRQFEFAVTDSVPFSIAVAEAEIDVLGK
jgi:hypothetical protein